VRSDHSVNAIPGLVYENTGPYRFADGNVGRIYESGPRWYVGGMAGWVSCRAAASVAPEPRYELVS
jgi:hypothetical protein